MADTPQAEPQAEQATEPDINMPSKALYMDFETAMHRTKALFAAIWELADSSTDYSSEIVDLASIGEDIIRDQLKYLGQK